MGTEDIPLWRRSATHMVHAIFLLKAQVEDRVFAATGLFLADNEALLNLAHAEGPLRMSDIANRLVLTRGGTTKVIDRLEEKGLVARRPDPDDRRATVVELTAAGVEMQQRARAIVDAGLHDLWARHLTDDQLAVLLEAADTVLGTHSASEG